MLDTMSAGVRWRWGLAAAGTAGAAIWLVSAAGCAPPDPVARIDAGLRPSAAATAPATTPATSAMTPAAISTAQRASTRGGNLILRVAGARAGVDQDVLRVNGKAYLAGRLELRFAKGYIPAQGVRFTVVQARGGINGSFASITNNVGLKLASTRDATHLYVTVAR